MQGGYSSTSHFSLELFVLCVFIDDPVRVLGQNLHRVINKHTHTSGVVRIDPLCFLDRCRKKQLNQAVSVLSLSLDFL